jgi:hypothetical protein
MTPVGVVVANPAYVDDKAIRARFAKNRYHGTVVWSWQHAMLASGIARQLRRADLPPDTRTALTTAQAALWDVITRTSAARHSELWSYMNEIQRSNLFQNSLIVFVGISIGGDVCRFRLAALRFVGLNMFIGNVADCRCRVRLSAQSSIPGASRAWRKAWKRSPRSPIPPAACSPNGLGPTA